MQNFTEMDNINAKFLVISVFVLKEREKKNFYYSGKKSQLRQITP